MAAGNHAARRGRLRAWLAGALAVGTTSAVVIIVSTAEPAAAQSSPAPVDLGKAGSFAAFAEDSVGNGRLPTVIAGDVGVNQAGPDALEGFPPGILDGEVHVADAVAERADSDIETAYDDLAGRAADETVGPQLGGMTLAPGVYRSIDDLDLDGTLTLDAQGDHDAVFIFQTPEDASLIAQLNSAVVLTNGADACNVFWQVGQDFALFNGSRFAGTVLASRLAALNEGAAVAGRLLVRDGPVVFVAGNNVVTLPDCDARAASTTRHSSSTQSDGRQAGPHESADREPSGGESADRRSARTESADDQSMADESAGDESRGEESASRRSADGDSTGDESTGGDPATGRSAGDQQAGDLPPYWPTTARLPGPDGSIPGFVLPQIGGVPSVDGLLGLGGLLPS
ncbi:ice-binding family protein [Pseudonocardia sp. CA-142604]|uniref:ice-binding family protein n=1 Tax=Pseudonocardia sp. CA-142604 TaxID=3240024 RepID=UPI003D8B3D01